MILNFKKKLILTAALSLFCLPQISLADDVKWNDVYYDFDSTKVKVAESPFYFFRSFVDFFYLSIKENPKSLTSINKLAQVKAWCAGDAHAENFGFLIQEKGPPLFTFNDFDDSSPCPVIYDLFRFLVGSKLYDHKISIAKITKAYLDGLKQNIYPQPATIDEMMTKAIKKGRKPSDKKVQNDKLIRDDQMSDVDSTEELQITKALIDIFENIGLYDMQILDLVATTKIGGGSGGLLRYEVLVLNKGTPLHLEFKEQTRPGIYPVLDSIPSVHQRVHQAINYSQGPTASKLYQVVRIKSKNMLVRPKFAGNVGVKLDKIPPDERNELLHFEANTLGLIHSRSIKNLTDWIKLIESTPTQDLEKDVDLIRDYFHKKYIQLKTLNFV